MTTEDVVPAKMTNAERTEVAQVIKRNFKVAISGIEQHKKLLIAEFEAALAKKWSPFEDAWKAAFEVAQRAVAESNEIVKDEYLRMGGPKEFAPSLDLGWNSRGENAAAGRRTELRRVAHSRIDAEAARAKLELRRREAEMLTELSKTVIRSEEALAFLNNVPSLDSLMPHLTIEAVAEEVEGSKRIERDALPSWKRHWDG